MAINLAAIPTEEAGHPPVAIVNGNGKSTIHYLNSLRASSLPLVYDIVQDLQDEFGLISEVSSKQTRTAREKCLRPETKKKYPWFTLGHIRDYLRFRTYLYRASDFEDVLGWFVHLQNIGRISIVKIDAVKLVNPGVFGWRMIAIDIRIVATGMLVEHYMTFREMIEINEAWLHKVYEAWRSVSTDDMTTEELRIFFRDAEFSRHAYRELLFDGILREQPRGSTLTTERLALHQTVLAALTSTLNLR